MCILCILKVNMNAITLVPKECVGSGCSPAKANTQAKLVEWKVCFISDAGNWRRGRADICPKTEYPTDNQGESFYTELGATGRNSTVISDTLLQIGHRQFQKSNVIKTVAVR